MVDSKFYDLAKVTIKNFHDSNITSRREIWRTQNPNTKSSQRIMLRWE